MKPQTKERKRIEKKLLFCLQLYNELKGREGVTSTLLYFETEIDRLVELLKQM